jgi:hypothetical protein
MFTKLGENRLQPCWCLHLLLLGPSPGRLHGPTCSPPHGGDRLHHWWCFHLLLLGASPGRVHGPSMFSISQRGQAPALVVLDPSPGRLFGPTCSPPHRGDRLQYWYYWVLLQVGFLVLHVLHLMVGRGSSIGGVFIYFFWVLLQVGFMVLHVQLPHRRNRLQHWLCLHLLLLGPSPGRLHGPSCTTTSQTEQAPALVVSSPTSSGSFSR